MLLNMRLRHKAHTAMPHRRRVVQHIKHRKPARVLLSELVKLLLKQDVLGGDLLLEVTE